MLRSAARWSAIAATALLLIGLASSDPVAAKDVTWLGVYTQEVTPELREGLNYNGSGVLVSRVIPGSPAAKAGLRRGDVIVRVGSRNVDSHDELSELVRTSPSGRTVDVQIVRDGRRDVLSVTLESRDDEELGFGDRDGDPTPAPRALQRDDAEADDDDRDDAEDDDGEIDDEDDDRDVPPLPRAPRAPRSPSAPLDSDDVLGLRDMAGMLGRGRLGVRVQTLNPDLASYFGARGTRGALVLHVTEDSPAQRAGIRAGDVVTRLGSRSIDDADDLIEAVRSSDGTVSITLIRHGQRQTVEARLDPMPRTMELRRRPRAFEWHSDGDRTRLRTIDPPRVRAFVRRDDDELRKMLDELRKEIDELRRQLDERQ
jgi:C-terminal processing protease CtpA/Prc